MQFLLCLAFALAVNANLLHSLTSSPSQFIERSLYDDTDDPYISYVNSLLSSTTFFGNWQTSLPGESLGDSFVNSAGYLYMHYESDQEFDFGFQIFDGEYMDQQVLTLLYGGANSDVSYNIFNSTLYIESSSANYQVGETYGELGEVKDCTLTTNVYLTDTTTGYPFVLTGNKEADLNHLGVQFQVIATACPLNITSTILTDVNPLFQSQGIPYFIVFLLLGFAQCVVCFLLEKMVLKKEGYARRISPWSVLILNAFDLYFLLATAYFFMSYSPIYTIAVIPFAFLSFFYEPRLVWRIFKIHGRRLDTRRRSRLEIKSYFGILLYFLCLLVSLVVYPNFVYLLISIFLLPQIKHNFSRSQKYRWNLWILLGLGTPKLIFALYTKLDPSNLLRITPDSMIIAIFIGLVSLTTILLALQTKYPRFGIDNKSAYKIYISKRTAKSSQEICAICLERLKASTASATQSFLDNKKARTMILTPCKHEFHLICLNQWVKSKLECPYCRTGLPPLPEDEDDE